MRFIDLFAGIGGFRLGLERANKGLAGDRETNLCLPEGQEEVNSPRDHHPQANRPNGCTVGSTYPEGFRCVWSCEIDRWCEQVYRRNFGQRFDAHDVKAVDATTIPDFDLLVSGFPCQSFSTAGKRRGFADTRGTLFFHICRILRVKRPRLLLLENVKGLLSDDGGRTFHTILQSLDELGYDLEWEVLNSKNFGVPQNRERVFIVGHLRGTPRPQVFPLGEDAGVAVETPGGEGQETASALRSHQSGGFGDPEMTLLACNQRKEIRGTDIAMSLQADGPGSRKGQMANLVFDAYNQRLTKDAGAVRQNMLDGGPLIVHNVYGGFGETKPRVFEDYSPTIRTPKGGGHLPMVVHSGGFCDDRICSPDGVAPSLMSCANTGGRHQAGISHKNPIIAGVNLRRLTPLECERLQSFPDGWTEGVSDTQRYKMLGNAVTVNVVEAIGERLLQVMDLGI